MPNRPGGSRTAPSGVRRRAFVQRIRSASVQLTEAEAKDRWRSVGKCIIMVSNVASEFQKLEVTRKEIEKHQHQIKNFLEYGSSDTVRSRAIFDPSHYRRPKDGMYLSRDLEEAAKNRSLRTANQARSLRLKLRECSSFAAYPNYVQEELSRVGLLERYDRARVLLREGHLPARVYFILSGTVVMTRFNKELREEETVQILNKGDIFGDAEVLDGCRRVATVTTALDVVLWSVDGEDFKSSMTRSLEYHAAKRTESSCGEERVGSSGMTASAAIQTFLSSLHWFEGIPMEKFGNDPKSATLVYFRNNKCVVSSSKENDLLCFVKSGKCDVLSRLSLDHAGIRPQTGVSCFDTGMSYWNRGEIGVKPLTGIIPTGKQGPPTSEEPSSPPAKQKKKVGRLRPITAPPSSTSRTKPKITITRPSRPGTGLQTRPPPSQLLSPSSRPITSSSRNFTSLSRPLTSNCRPTTSNSRPRPAISQSEKPPSRKAPQEQFVRVCTLTCGDVYGLTSLFSEEDLETSLVSRGCECVVVKKDVFLLLLNRETKESLKSKIVYYPSYSELKHKLLNLHKWSEYRKRTVLKKA